MKRLFTGCTDPGLVRTANQDNYYIDNSDGRYFIVADGMGGHAGGEEASAIATQTIRTYLDQYWDSAENSESLLEKALYAANEAILQDQSSNPARSDMGTTVVVVMFRQQDCWVAHVGDSRIYQLRDDNLQQITEDHTWVAKAMKMGDLSAQEARVHPWRHVLSQCLGRKDLRQIDIRTITVQTGDRLLLCSDGLTEEVADEVIAQHLQTESTQEKAAQALIATAKQNGGKDNITVVLVYIDK